MFISLLCVIFVNFYNLYVHVYLETICVIAKFAIIYSLFGSNIYIKWQHHIYWRYLSTIQGFVYFFIIIKFIIIINIVIIIVTNLPERQYYLLHVDMPLTVYENMYGCSCPYWNQSGCLPKSDGFFYVPKFLNSVYSYDIVLYFTFT